ncbi:MAG: hypothetical protein QOG48_834 [Verrucomicrobiota bacterium]
MLSGLELVLDPSSVEALCFLPFLVSPDSDGLPLSLGEVAPAADSLVALPWCFPEVDVDPAPLPVPDGLAELRAPRVLVAALADGLADALAEALAEGDADADGATDALGLALTVALADGAALTLALAEGEALTLVEAPVPVLVLVPVVVDPV